MTVEVKVCGITNRKDAESALIAGAKYLGFILYPKSPRFISTENSRFIIESLKNFSFRSVAVDVCPAPEKVKLFKEAGFQYFQLHFPLNFDTTIIRHWSELVGCSNLWLAPQLPPGSDFPENLLKHAKNFLIDCYSQEKFGGTGKPADWKSFSKYQKKYPEKKWILAGGIGPDNIAYALQQLDLELVDVNSAVESVPGLKDENKIKNLFLCLQGLEK